MVTFNGALPDDHEPRQLPFTSPTGSGDAMIAVFWANHGANHEFPSNKVFYDIANSNWGHDVFVHFCDNCSTDAETQWLLRVTWNDVQPASQMGVFSTCAADDIAEFEACQVDLGCNKPLEDCIDCPTESEYISQCYRNIDDECWDLRYSKVYRCAANCDPGDESCFDWCESEYYSKLNKCNYTLCRILYVIVSSRYSCSNNILQRFAGLIY